MQPKGISKLVRVGMLSAAVLGVVLGAGLDHLWMIPADPMRAHIDEERLKAMNDDRHKKLALDVDRLLALSNELKSDLDKANKDELSVTVIRKAAEIEKLAHDVQSRMKN